MSEVEPARHSAVSQCFREDALTVSALRREANRMVRVRESQLGRGEDSCESTEFALVEMGENESSSWK